MVLSQSGAEVTRPLSQKDVTLGLLLKIYRYVCDSCGKTTDVYNNDVPPNGWGLLTMFDDPRVLYFCPDCSTSQQEIGVKYDVST